MIVVDGKRVLETLEELVDPARVAVLLIDLQHDFIEPSGAFGALGVDVSAYEQMRPRVATLIAAARDRGVRIVHLQNAQLPDSVSDSPAQIRFNLRMHAAARAGGPPLAYTRPGTPGFEFIPEARPVDGEVVVRKHRSSGFWGTNLAQILRSNDIESVLVVGCTTEGCVESTARDALFNDFYVVIASDCVASDDHAQHDASMLLMSHRFDLTTSTEVMDVWETA